jgi:hypothetical protein
VAKNGPLVGVIHEPDEALPRDLVLLRKLARLLDGAVAIPGTNRRVGLDPLIGLIPGVGDAIGAVIGAAYLFSAVRHRVPAGTLLRMAGAVAADLLVGTIPVVGDLFDAFYASNLQNVERIVAARHRTKDPRSGKGTLTLVALVLLAVLLVLVVGVVALARMALRAVGI